MNESEMPKGVEHNTVERSLLEIGNE